MPRPTVHAATTATMGYLSEFLQTLKYTRRHRENLLITAAFCVRRRVSDGYTHSSQTFNIDRWSGRRPFKGQLSLRLTQFTEQYGSAALQGAGVPMSSFGAEGATPARPSLNFSANSSV